MPTDEKKDESNLLGVAILLGVLAAVAFFTLRPSAESVADDSPFGEIANAGTDFQSGAWCEPHKLIWQGQASNACLPSYRHRYSAVWTTWPPANPFLADAHFFLAVLAAIMLALGLAELAISARRTPGPSS